MPRINLEIPIFSSSITPSLANTATRLELNAPDSYPSGGLTPPISTLSTLTSSVSTGIHVPVRVMIRPRGPPPQPNHDFIYSDDELEAMTESIRAFKASGLMSRERGDGFVFGVLSLQESSSGAGTGLPSIDLRANKRLVEEAHPYGCAFHRAFDSILATGTSVEDTVETLLTCGFDGVLTSGGPGNAVDNLPVFRGLVASAKGRLDILIGGGVRAENAERILETVGPGARVWLHSSCLGKSGTDQVDEEEAAALVRVMRDSLK